MKCDEYLIGIHDLPAILEAATKLSTKHGFQSRDWQIWTSPPRPVPFLSEACARGRGYSGICAARVSIAK